MIEAVIFDLDDTLFAEREYVVQGFEHIAKLISERYDIQNVYNKSIELFNIDKDNLYGRLLNSYGISYSKSDIEYLVSEYRDYKRNGLTLYEDVVPSLQHLKSSGYKLGIITDGRPEGQNNKLDALNIREYFDKIIITDDLGVEYRKPHKKAFEVMAQALGVVYERMLYVGDNRAKDFAVAKELPITTAEIVRYNKIHETQEYLKGKKPNYIIQSLWELIECLKTI